MIPTIDDSQTRLIAEQLGHTLDLIRAEISTIQAEQAHQAEMSAQRLVTLEGQTADFEKRLRDLTESATQFKLLVSLSVGGGLLSLIALLRSLLTP
jgi:uncharacterized protein involved in exopolysaccharide biosynthesis